MWADRETFPLHHDNRSPQTRDQIVSELVDRPTRPHLGRLPLTSL
jgi:hypothetical protein